MRGARLRRFSIPKPADRPFDVRMAGTSRWNQSAYQQHPVQSPESRASGNLAQGGEGLSQSDSPVDCGDAKVSGVSGAREQPGGHHRSRQQVARVVHLPHPLAMSDRQAPTRAVPRQNPSANLSPQRSAARCRRVPLCQDSMSEARHGSAIHRHVEHPRMKPRHTADVCRDRPSTPRLALPRRRSPHPPTRGERVRPRELPLGGDQLCIRH